MGERRMRAELQPNVHAELGDGVDRRRELHRLPNSASPVRRITPIAVETAARNRAEKWDVLRLRRKIDQRILERIRRRLHHRMMKRMIDPHESCEHTLRFQFGEHRFDRASWTGEGDGPGTVERGNRNSPIVRIDQNARFYFAEADSKHLTFAKRAILHETR